MSDRTLSVAVAVIAIRGASGKCAPQFRELSIFRPKIVAPLADAMGFIDGDLPHFHVFAFSKKSGSIKRSGAM